jgi:hypothetical protein
VKFAYFEKRDDADSNLAQRATLYSELALATYLVNSLASGSEDDVDWASTELEILAKSVAEGSARVLSRVSFVQTFAVASEPVDQPVFTETKVTVSETKEEVDLSDLKTRPIELPTSSDDQLF